MKGSVIQVLASSSVDKGGIKGQSKTGEILACVTADRGPGEESSEMLLGETDCQVLEPMEENGTQSMSARTGLREDRAPSPL